MPQRRHVAYAALTAAAATALLALATPAWASSTIPLHESQKGSTAAGFKTQDCEDERFDDLAANQDGWHFVLPGNDGGSFETLTLTFNDGTNDVEIKVPDATDAYPDYLYSTGGKDPRTIHAYVFTPAGWTLVDGSATISGENEFFNLSHTCPGTPSNESPSPSPPAPSESPSESPSGGVSGTPSASVGGGDKGSLPITGVAATSIALAGVVLIGGGVTLMMLRRRRDKITFTS